MITKKQAKLLRQIIINRRLGSGYVWVRAGSRDKALLDQIKAGHPEAIRWLYGGAAQTVGEHAGCCCFCTEDAAFELLQEYAATEVVGYDGVAEVEDARGITERKEFHYRADSEARLKQAIRRGIARYHKFAVVELRPMTDAQWVQAYGWGRM